MTQPPLPPQINASVGRASSVECAPCSCKSMLLRVLRNVGAAIVGLIGGGLAMSAIHAGGNAALPPPIEVNASDIVSINAHIGEYSVLQLMVPFAAHAFGTLMGAYFATLLAGSYKLVIAIIIGAMFLLAGIGMVLMIPNSPLWFSTLDLCVAYLPMAAIGWWMAGGLKRA